MSILLKIRRGETPFYRRLRRIVLGGMHFKVPVPRLARPVFRQIYNAHWGTWSLFRHLLAIFYITPVFESRCEKAGSGLFVFLMPHVVGHTRIEVGENVGILGKISISSGQIYDRPVLKLGDGVVIAHQVQFSVNQEVCLEEGVFVAGRCTIADNDGHPIDPDLRVSHVPPFKKDIKPVRICRRAWIAEGAQIRKGVTVGEGAIVGVNSVVLKDVPPHTIVMGNPAKVVGFVGRTAVQTGGKL